MATIVLTTVGTIFGGPIGGMIGAMAGQYIDQNILFKPKAVHGPRLTDLAVQTSSYGTQVPRIYGRMRVSGTVIWALPLKENRKKHSAKGQPTQYTYSYTASFAVALSSRQIAGVGRIWADGTLIRQPGGRFTLDTGFRIHHGSANQAPDPLIASAQGIAVTPAHRDLAYVVFENMPLADFGNRIPSLSFELIGDAVPVSGAAILEELAPQLVDAQSFEPGGGFTPYGYAASGSSVRQAVQPLIDASGVSVRAGKIAAEQAPLAMPSTARASGDSKPWLEKKREPAASVPATIAVRHYDPERDWLIGLERASVAGSAGSKEVLMDCPMALSKPLARSLAASYASRAVEAQDHLRVPAGPWALGVPAGSVLRLPDIAGDWRVEQWRWNDKGGELLLRRHHNVANWPTDVPLPPVDETPGALHAALFDLPAWPQFQPDAGALLALAQASETGGGSVEASVQLSIGAELTPIARIPDAPTLGQAETVLGVGSTALVDTVSSVVIALVNPEMELQHASDAALFAGANAAMLGGELVQFGRADPLSPSIQGRPRYRLSRFLRGRGGTEDLIGTHAVGDAFALIADEAGQLALPLLPDRIGMQPLTVDCIVALRRPGTEELLLMQPASVGRASMPLSPTHLFATPDGVGGLLLNWIRRSRDGWYWRDGVDVSLDEPNEQHSVTITPNVGTARSIDVAAPSLSISASDLAEWRAGGVHALTIAVRQIGRHALSPPATLSLTL